MQNPRNVSPQIVWATSLAETVIAPHNRLMMQ